MGHTVLIVDDEPDLVESCVRLLVPFGYFCLRAHTGQDAIALIDRDHPSLVLTDLYLPDVDGVSVLSHARAQAPPIPCILMTAHISRQTVSHVYDTGAIVYLPKPFSRGALIEAVGRALRVKA